MKPESYNILFLFASLVIDGMVDEIAKRLSVLHVADSISTRQILNGTQEVVLPTEPVVLPLGMCTCDMYLCL